MSSIASTLFVLRKRLNDVTLIAVSKTQSIEAIREALLAGQRIFGENRVQEAQRKFSALRAEFPDIELHLIGPLQTNKAQNAVEVFDVIHTLDRPALAEALAKAMRKTARKPRLYIEVNIGNEPQKSGVTPDKLDELLSFCKNSCGLSISGLMCLPPKAENPSAYFQNLRALADRLSLPHVSMGMSDDYETALECGATEVRIGTAIFGERL